jgi:hypothetical protein
MKDSSLSVCVTQENVSIDEKNLVKFAGSLCLVKYNPSKQARLMNCVKPGPVIALVSKFMLAVANTSRS